MLLCKSAFFEERDILLSILSQSEDHHEKIDISQGVVSVHRDMNMHMRYLLRAFAQDPELKNTVIRLEKGAALDINSVRDSVTELNLWLRMENIHHGALSTGQRLSSLKNQFRNTLARLREWMGIDASVHRVIRSMFERLFEIQEVSSNLED